VVRRQRQARQGDRARTVILRLQCARVEHAAPNARSAAERRSATDRMICARLRLESRTPTGQSVQSIGPRDELHRGPQDPDATV
jgi:hypothetical protein